MRIIIDTVSQNGGRYDILFEFNTLVMCRTSVQHYTQPPVGHSLNWVGSPWGERLRGTFPLLLPTHHRILTTQISFIDRRKRIKPARVRE